VRTGLRQATTPKVSDAVPIACESPLAGVGANICENGRALPSSSSAISGSFGLFAPGRSLEHPVPVGHDASGKISQAKEMEAIETFEKPNVNSLACAPWMPKLSLRHGRVARRVPQRFSTTASGS